LDTLTKRFVEDGTFQLLPDNSFQANLVGGPINIYLRSVSTRQASASQLFGTALAAFARSGAGLGCTGANYEFMT
jgi:hypothetical protein